MHCVPRSRGPSWCWWVTARSARPCSSAARRPSSPACSRGDNLAAHYASADLFLFPSTTETFGNVLPEAMASGLAVVAYDYAAARQLVRHGDNGLLVPYDNSAAFCAAAQRLAGQLSWVRAMGQRSRLAAQGQDWSAIVKQVEQAYLGAMSGFR